MKKIIVTMCCLILTTLAVCIIVLKYDYIFFTYENTSDSIHFEVGQNNAPTNTQGAQTEEVETNSTKKDDSAYKETIYPTLFIALLICMTTTLIILLFLVLKYKLHGDMLKVKAEKEKTSSKEKRHKKENEVK